MNFRNTLFATMATLVVSSPLWSAGYEKVNFWSAKWSALGAAASAGVEGAEALYFNPAGLVHGSNGEISVNISPTKVTSEGPIVGPNTSVEDEGDITPPLGVVGKYQLNEKMAIGVGLYTVAGVHAVYEGVDLSTVTSTMSFSGLSVEQKSDLMAMELGLGFSYKATNNLSLGLTWRATQVKAEVSGVTINPIFAVNAKFKDLDDTNFEGFRLGLQYVNDEKTYGVGLSYRSEVEFEIKGDQSGSYRYNSNTAVLAAALSGRVTPGSEAATAAALNAAGVQTLTSAGEATLKSQLPQQISLGNFFKFGQNCFLFTEVTWTEYSQNDKIRVIGDLRMADAFGTNLGNILADGDGDIDQSWKDQWNVKVSTQYTLDEMSALRFGYVLTTKVTIPEKMRASFSAPGTGHSLFAGYGQKLNESMIVDGALEYAMNSGTGTNENGFAGEVKNTVIGMHLSYKYLF